MKLKKMSILLSIFLLLCSTLVNGITVIAEEVISTKQVETSIDLKNEKNNHTVCSSKDISLEKSSDLYQNSDINQINFKEENSGELLENKNIDDTSESSSEIKITNSTLYLNNKDGSFTELVDGSSINIGDKVKLDILWEIENVSNLSEGSILKIDLPSNYLYFPDSAEQSFILDNDDTVGTFYVANNQICIKFNSSINEYSSIKNAFFNIYGTAIEKKTEEESIDTDVNIPNIIINENNGTPNASFPDREGIYKNGAQITNSNSIQWQVDVNFDSLKNVLTGSSNLIERNNAMFVDELTQGQLFKSIVISTDIYKVDSNNQLTGTGIDYLNLVEKGTFKEIMQDDTESFESFYSRLKYQPGNYGIFTEINGSQTVIISFGDLPGGVSSSRNITDSVSSVENNDSLTDKEKENTIDSLYRLNTATNGTMFLGTRVFINTQVNKDTPSKQITNTGKLIFDGGNESNYKTTIQYNSIDSGGSGISVGELLILKSDELGNRLTGVVFKLQKWNEDNNKYEDYNIDFNEQTTDENGEIRYKNLSYGKYKVVEVKGLLGYGSPVFETTDNFEVSSSQTKGTKIQVTNPKINTISIVLQANKVLTGKTLTAGDFNFELKDSEGTILQTKSNATTGAINFDEISYDQAGTYNYTISEVIGNKTGMTYD